MAIKTKSLSITSDVVQRLTKIRENIVYSSSVTFVDELIQNVTRAKSSVCYIDIQEDTFSIRDNGIGCPEPKVLFTLDLSGFGVGFGEGFGSVYAVADSLMVKTHDWVAKLDVENAIQKKDLALDITHNNSFKDGFELYLKGKKIERYQQKIIEQVINVAQYIPNTKFYLNDNLIPKKNLFILKSNPKIQSYFSNRMYDGRIGLLPSRRYGQILIYSDYRLVTYISTLGAEGAILLKPNAVNLRTPDRKDIIYDNKRDRLERKLDTDIKYLTKELLKVSDATTISDYSETIEAYLSVNEYIQYLTINENEILNQYETRDKLKPPVNTDNDDDLYDEDAEYSTEKNEVIYSINPTINNNHVSSSIPVHSNDTDLQESLNNESNKPVINSGNPDTKRVVANKSITSYVQPTPNYMVTKNDMKSINIKSIKYKKNIIWVEKEKSSDKSDLIAKYEYYGIFTFVSPHVLYDKALTFMGIPHIDSVQSHAIEKQYEVTRTGSKNKKEERAMELLSMIEQLLDVGKVFYISDIKCKMIVNLRSTKIYQEPLLIEGYASYNDIHLNRKSLKFGKLSSILLNKKNIGIHDVKFILSNLELITHELAHLMYNTQDNTIEHYEAMLKIQNKITDFILEQE